MPRVFAAADIGSNTAHLLVAACDSGLVMRLDNLNEWIALGETVARVGEILEEQTAQLVGSIREFKRVAAAHGASGLYVFATEAVRSARNHRQVLEAISKETGIEVEVISPRREAELSFRGVTLDAGAADPQALFEVGGGSAQVGHIDDGRLTEEASLPLGTGRVIAEAGIVHPCPEAVVTTAKEYVEAQLFRIPFDIEPSGTAVASGGVARGLWRAMHPDGEKRVALEELEYLAWSCARLPIDRIIRRFNVKAKRAGTLLPGSLVYASLMRHFGITEMSISEFGVREGAILELAKGSLKPCPV